MSDDTLLCVLAQTSLVASVYRAAMLRTRSVYCCTLSELKGDHLVGVVTVPSCVASLGTASHTATEPEEPMATHSASSA